MRQKSQAAHVRDAVSRCSQAQAPRPPGAAQAKLSAPAPLRPPAAHVQAMIGAAQARPAAPAAARPAPPVLASSPALQCAKASRIDFGSELEELREAAIAHYFPTGLPRDVPRPTLHHKISNETFRVLEQNIIAATQSAASDVKAGVAEFVQELYAASAVKSGNQYQKILDSIPFNLELGPNATQVLSQAGSRFDPSTMPVMSTEGKPTLERRLTPVSAELKKLDALITGRAPTGAEWKAMAGHLRAAGLAHARERKEANQAEIMRREEQWRLDETTGKFMRLGVDAKEAGAYGQEAYSRLTALAESQRTERREKAERERRRAEDEAKAVMLDVEARKKLRNAAKLAPRLARHYRAELTTLGITVAGGKTQLHGQKPPSEATFRARLVLLGIPEAKLPPPLTPPSASAVVSSSAGSATVPSAPLTTVTVTSTRLGATEVKDAEGGGRDIGGPVCRFIIRGRCRA